MTSTCPHRAWLLAPADDAVVESLCAASGLSAVTARVLAARGITDKTTLDHFFDPTLDRDWLDPSAIPGMDAAAARVARAIELGEHVLVFGDFDLDGISAAAVAARGLAALGARVSSMVPHRFDEGYGLTPAAVERAVTFDPQLIVTVDCGISSEAEVAALVERGIDVVVTDHHEPGEHVPRGVPVANPKLDASCPSRDLAGAGVALKLVQAVGRLAGNPDTWKGLTDLATLGTVADIVPLVGENRALVAHGIERTRTDPRVGLAALLEVAGANAADFASDTVSFALAPRLNAAGRMADPAISLELLLSENHAQATDLARTLDEHNRVRQAAEAELTEAATALAQRTFTDQRALVLAGEGWHEGVKGIVASRLAQSYGVPTILFTIEDGIAKGSGRSVGHVDLFAALTACAPILQRFGGHEAAVGLALEANRLEEFERMLLAYLDTVPAQDFVSGLRVDAYVALDELGVELGSELSLLEPFGHSNPRPIFGTRCAFMNGRERVGRGASHLKFTAFDGVASLPAIAFRCDRIDDMAQREAAVDLAYELAVDEWRGRKRAQLIVRDIVVRDDSEQGPAAALVEDLFARADELLAREEYAGIPDAPSFHTKLAGVTFEGRQEVLSRLTGGAPLRVVRQPDNEYDPNACALFDAHGSQVGFFNRRLAAVLAPVLDAGVEYDVEVTEVTGGEAGKAMGVNVAVSRRDLVAAEDDSEARREAREALAALPVAQLDEALTRAFIGDRSLHDAQRQALDSLARGRNTLTVMATGRGKSLIFHLHAAREAIAHGRASVFVFPLRALVADQSYHLDEAFGAVGLTVRTVTGESSPAERDKAFTDLASGDLDVVLTTPEFLHFHAQRFAAAQRVRFLVVDEAHHVGLARAGHRPAYGRLDQAIELLGGPTVLAVTATASTEVAQRITSVLGIERTVLDPTVRDNLRVDDARGGADKDSVIAALAARGDKCVVYVNSRDASVRLARMLRKRVPEIGWKVAFYNGGLSRPVRHAVERAFRESEIQVVIATSAFGEGVNIPDIRHVVLYHLPFNDVEFNQMAGRAGRDGKPSHIHLLFGAKDARINETILSASAPSREDLAVVYRVLRDEHERSGEGFELTNAEIAQRCTTASGGTCRIDDKAVSAAVGIFRELGLVSSEGHASLRRLSVVAGAPRVELTASVRYAEGLDEIDEFGVFREWVMNAPAQELLERFNRPILPS